MSFLEAIEVNGVKLSFDEKGSGPSVILIHGIPTDYRAWENQMAVLSKSFRAISYSRRCAYPNQNKDYLSSTIENNADDLNGLIAIKKAEPANLIGHSYGAFVALYFAYKHPELVRSLVLIEPYVPSLIIENPQNRLEILSLLFRNPSVALAAQNFLNKSLTPAIKYVDRGDDEKAVEAFLDGVQGKPNAISQITEPTKSMMLNNAGTIKELTSKLPHFTKKEANTICPPTLLISGENTPKALHAIAEEVSKTVPKIQVLRIPNSAHFPHFENPEATNAAIMRFLNMQNL